MATTARVARNLPAFRGAGLIRGLSSTPGQSGGGGGGRGRGKGSLTNFMNANRAVVNSFDNRGGKGGPQSARTPPRDGGGGKGSSFAASGRGGKGSFSGGRGGGKGRKGGKGGSGSSSDERAAPLPTAVRVTLSRGQFDDAEYGSTSQAEMMDDLIERSLEAPDGILIYDYVATDEEQSAAAAKFDQAISRPLPELLAYSDVTTALGESEAKTAPPTVQEAWGISSRNPYITHDQRVEIAGFVDAHMRELERSSSNAEGEVSMLEFALTPPDDFRGNY